MSDTEARETRPGEPVRCPECSRRLGLDMVARVTIIPTTGRRRKGGPIVLDEKRLICADCWELRGLTTPLA